MFFRSCVIHSSEVSDFAYISKGTTLLVCESNISQTRCVHMATNRLGKSICHQICLSSWILGVHVIVWLLYTIESSKHLISILEIVILSLLRYKWFEIKRMRITVCTRHSSSSPPPNWNAWARGYASTHSNADFCDIALLFIYCYHLAQYTHKHVVSEHN